MSISARPRRNPGGVGIWAASESGRGAERIAAGVALGQEQPQRTRGGSPDQPVDVAMGGGLAQVAQPADAQEPISRIDEDRKSTRLNSSHIQKSRMPSSA